MNRWRPWLPRVGVLVLLVVGGQVVLSALDFEPHLRGWALMSTAIVALLWLAYDVTATGGADWDDPLSPYARPDAADESVHHRVLTGHLSARDPGPALRHLLIDLARGRDPDLTDPELRAFADNPVRRLGPDDIDRLLSRMEEPRDHE